MKKTLLLSMALSCTSVLFATDTVLFTGETASEAFNYTDIISWQVANLAGSSYVNFGTAEAPSCTTIGNNPEKAGINTTAKALQLSSLQGKSWWGDFLNLKLTDAITITDANRYLHFFHYRENLNQGFSVNINKDTPWEDPDKGTKRFDLNLAEASKWEDVVIDLKWFKDNAEALNMITVLVDRNWGGGAEPATNYYFDEVVLNDNPLPRGVTVLTDTEMSFSVSNQADYTKWVKSSSTQNSESTMEIVANPFTTKLEQLNAPSVMKFNKSANASWWQGPMFKFNGTLKVGQNSLNSFLHVMVNIPEMEAGVDYYVVQLCAKDFSGAEVTSSDVIKYWADTDKGNWYDCVLDVTSLGYVSQVEARFDVRKDANDAYINSPAGTFYLDAIAINNSEDQRTQVITSVKTSKDEVSEVYALGRSIVVKGNVSQVSVFNALGQLVSKTDANESLTTVNVENGGIYFVKAVSSNGAGSSYKILVQ